MSDLRRALAYLGFWKPHEYVDVALIGIHADEVSRSQGTQALSENVGTPEERKAVGKTRLKMFSD